MASRATEMASVSKGSKKRGRKPGRAIIETSPPAQTGRKLPLGEHIKKSRAPSHGAAVSAAAKEGVGGKRVSSIAKSSVGKKVGKKTTPKTAVMDDRRNVVGGAAGASVPHAISPRGPGRPGFGSNPSASVPGATTPRGPGRPGINTDVTASRPPATTHPTTGQKGTLPTKRRRQDPRASAISSRASVRY